MAAALSKTIFEGRGGFFLSAGPAGIAEAALRKLCARTGCDKSILKSAKHLEKALGALQVKTRGLKLHAETQSDKVLAQQENDDASLKDRTVQGFHVTSSSTQLPFDWLEVQDLPFPALKNVLLRKHSPLVCPNLLILIGERKAAS